MTLNITRCPDSQLRLFSLFFFIGLLIPSSAYNQIYPDAELDDLICREQQRAAAWPELAQQRNYAADQTDMYYTEFHWDLDPAVYYIKGEITYHFKSKVNNLTQLVLDLDKTMQIHFIRRGNVDLNYIHSDDLLLTIDLNKSLSIGETDSLTISYEGTPHSTGFGSFEQDAHNGKPILWTQSVPYGVRDWWPSKQDLIDKIDSVDIYITTPLGQLAASNGKLISITEDNGKLVHHWKHHHPIVSYLVAFAITNYSSYKEFLVLPGGDTIHILNYVYPESLNEAKAMTPAAKTIMEFYNEKFGLYPYADEKFGHAQFSWGGGTEIQTMNFMTNFSTGLIAHELAHQWFGDKVTCGSYSDTWLNEGFATYLTGLTYEKFPAFGSFNNWKTSTRNNVVSEPGGSVFVADTSDTFRIFDSRLTYNKGAYVLHMLRWVVGDDAWFDACYNYLHLPHTSYGFGRTRDLQGELETSSGKDLDEFFADWYYGEGYPSYELYWIKPHTSDSIYFTLHQTPSHPSVSFFEMPVPVQAILGPQTFEFVLQNTQQDQQYAFYIGDVYPSQVYIDVNKWLLSKNNLVQEVVVEAIDIVDPKSQVKIWPNPVESYLIIESIIQINRAELINAQGIISTVSPVENKIDMTGQAPGLYTIRLFTGKNELAGLQRVIKL